MVGRGIVEAYFKHQFQRNYQFALRRLVAHPLSRGVCDAHPLPSCEFGYQLHVSAALEIGPGAREQVLHREEDSFTFFPLPPPNIISTTMWAIADFRADNGATLLVAALHLWVLRLRVLRLLLCHG